MTAWLLTVVAAAPYLPALIGFVQDEVAAAGTPAGAPSPEPAFPAIAAGSSPRGISDLRTPSKTGSGVGKLARSRARSELLAAPTPSEPLVSPVALPSEAPAAGELSASPVAFPGALDASITAVIDAPPPQPAPVVLPAASPDSAAGSSFLGDMSRLGRTSATTVRKAGVSVAGTFTRAGKALVKVF